MRQKFITAVYLFHSEEYSYLSARLNEIISILESSPEIVAVWDSKQWELTNNTHFISDVKKKGVNQIVIAGFKPGKLKPYFQNVFNDAGISDGKIQLVNIPFSQNGFHTGNLPLINLISSAVYNVPLSVLSRNGQTKVNSATLVIGGGIAGIQASLEIANSNNKVYLVEKTGTIGGHMAMFDKTFPTLDCAACILTPKMVEVGQHPNIELLTYSELREVEGHAGNFKAKILKKARRVDVTKCIGCGTCTEKCPGRAQSEFDAGTSQRKAIYIPFPQAVPNKYLIDQDSCLYIKKGTCGNCVKNCPVEGCINLNEQDEIVEMEVGNIVVATGFKTFDPAKMPQYGYGKYPNVITSLEFERLVNASGVTEGNIRLKSKNKKGKWIYSDEGKEPEKIAVIHCVGSRDENHHKYCSRVCCMYSLKLAHLAKEKLPAADVSEYYIDMRAYGKGYEEFYNRIAEEGVHLIRGKTATVDEKEGKLELRSEDIEGQRILTEQVDMVILAVGLEACSETNLLARSLGIEVSADGWLKEKDLLSNSVATQKAGIWIAGTCQGPKDIPDTVVQASAAAAGVIQSIQSSQFNLNLQDITPDIIKAKAKELSSINMD